MGAPLRFDVSGVWSTKSCSVITLYYDYIHTDIAYGCFYYYLLRIFVLRGLGVSPTDKVPGEDHLLDPDTSSM